MFSFHLFLYLLVSVKNDVCKEPELAYVNLPWVSELHVCNITRAYANE